MCNVFVPVEGFISVRWKSIYRIFIEERAIKGVEGQLTVFYAKIRCLRRNLILTVQVRQSAEL